MPLSVDKFAYGIWSRGKEQEVSHAKAKQLLRMNMQKGRDDAEPVAELNSSCKHGESYWTIKWRSSTEDSRCFSRSFKAAPD